MDVHVYLQTSKTRQSIFVRKPIIIKPIDLYSSIYDNHIILGDFNMESKNPKLAPFKHSSNLYDLILSNFDNANFQMDLKSKHNNCPKNTETLKKHLKTS